MTNPPLALALLSSLPGVPAAAPPTAGTGAFASLLAASGLALPKQAGFLPSLPVAQADLPEVVVSAAPVTAAPSPIGPIIAPQATGGLPAAPAAQQAAPSPSLPATGEAAVPGGAAGLPGAAAVPLPTGPIIPTDAAGNLPTAPAAQQAAFSPSLPAAEEAAMPAAAAGLPAAAAALLPAGPITPADAGASLAASAAEPAGIPELLSARTGIPTRSAQSLAAGQKAARADVKTGEPGTNAGATVVMTDALAGPPPAMAPQLSGSAAAPPAPAADAAVSAAAVPAGSAAVQPMAASTTPMPAKTTATAAGKPTPKVQADTVSRSGAMVSSTVQHSGASQAADLTAFPIMQNPAAPQAASGALQGDPSPTLQAVAASAPAASSRAASTDGAEPVAAPADVPADPASSVQPLKSSAVTVQASMMPAPALAGPELPDLGAPAAMQTSQGLGSSQAAAVQPLLRPGPAAALPATPPALSPAAAGTPAAQLAPALVQLSHAPGGPAVTLRLDPAELGHVQIHVERTADGATSVQVTAERPDTLRLLMADQPQLHRALDSAGVPQDGRSMALSLATPESGGQSPGGAGADGQPADGGSQAGSERQQRHPYAEAADAGRNTPSLSAWLRAGVDITA